MMRTFTAAIASLGLVVGTGCNKSEPGGHPSNRTSTNTNANTHSSTDTHTSGDATFTLSPPRLSTSLKPRESKPVTIDINRKDAFKESVTLTASDVPPALTVEPKTKVADLNTKEVAFTVTAAENAQPGDYIIKVSAKPEHPGKDTITDVKITVEKP